MTIHPMANGRFLVVDEETGEIMSEHATLSEAKAAVFAIALFGQSSGVEIVTPSH